MIARATAAAPGRSRPLRQRCAKFTSRIAMSPVPAPSQPRVPFGWIPVAAALVAALLLALSGTGVRLGFWDYRVGFGMLRWTVYVGIAATAASLTLLVVPRTRRGRAPVLAG